ncbi:Sphingomyelin phosphodiesterase B-like [Homarus americanus]|uniref:Sphingomyelin phosphodiesterase B-like n=1 Tax=Homarus americanus TaxID=6706 RepID=A0A8J5MNM2_HOMAM|nr:Sphingomyelin phosphodiesterase B-like [Homarus americanus]
MAPLTTLVTLLFLSLAAGVPLGDSYKEESVALEFRNALSTGHVGPTLKQVAKELDLRSWVVKESHEMKAADTINLFCPACNIGFGEIIHLVNNGTDPKNIVDKLIILCRTPGFTESFNFTLPVRLQSQLLWVMEHREGLTGKDMCGMMFGGLGCHTKNPDRVWEVTLPDVEKPPVTDPVLPEPGSPVMKILHLADTHYDPDYLPGSNAVCGEKYFCCRAESGPVVHPEDAAGKWGDYRNCDAPKWLLEKLYEHVNNNYEVQLLA